MSQEAQLMDALAFIEQADYPFQSRVHPLKSLSDTYIKRDDELGFGISGSKIRKYRTLIPYLKSRSIKHVGVIGGPFSNNVLGISQLLIENDIEPILFLKAAHNVEKKGNYFFLQHLLGERSIYWIPSKEWGEVETKAETTLKNYSSAFLLNEGASVREAFPGILTLPLDVLRNEKKSNLQFEHFFVDSGTGFSASSVILTFHWLKKETQVHVALLAGEETSFLKQLSICKLYFEELLNVKISEPKNFTLHSPKIARSFGSTNTELFQFIKKITQNEGFFIDPIYMAKTMHMAQETIIKHNLKNVLINHSGGSLSLSGFNLFL